ncbi:hypothetical protein ACMFMF_004474 [Clarireedia jacksonii]
MAAFIALLIPSLFQLCASAPVLETRQAYRWGHPTDASVISCYQSANCTSARTTWSYCQKSYISGSSTATQSSLTTECLCESSYPAQLNACLVCLENGNPMVLNTMNQLVSSLCANTLALNVYEEDAYIFGGWVDFPLLLPSTQLLGTAVTQPDQVVERAVEVERDLAGDQSS